MKAEDIATKVGMMSVPEVRLMKKLVMDLPENPLVVNIGANVGTSTISILESRPDAYVWSIDRNSCPDEKVNAIAVLGGEIAGRISRLLGDSSSLGRHFPVMIDCLVVDGDHTQKGCRKDLFAWKDKVKQGGIIFFHDYDHKKAPGVTVVVDNFEKQYPVKRLGKERYLVGFRVEGELK